MAWSRTAAIRLSGVGMPCFSPCALTDSPIGLAALFVEKFHSSSDCEHVEQAFGFRHTSD